MQTTVFKKNLLVRATSVAALALFAASAFAGGTHSHSHGHEKKAVDYSHAEMFEFGKASDPAHASQTITIDMTDGLRFEPSEVSVSRGETVRFVVKNTGTMMHEMILGTHDSLHEHAELMKKFPGMEHDELHMAHVSPGNEHVMGWQFTEAGEFHFGCLVPGHFEGGMKGTITVQ